MLRFVLGSTSAKDPAFIRQALFELGVRLNVQFSIHVDPVTIPEDGVIVLYGSVATEKVRGRNLLQLREAGSAAPCAPRRVGDLWCFGQEAEAGLDVVAGTATLLSFQHETGCVGLARDGLDRIPAQAHPLREHFQEPLVENNARYLRQILEGRFGDLPIASTPWEGTRGALVLTHDVDGPQLHAPFPLLRSLAKGLLGQRREMESFQLGALTLLCRRRDPYWNFEDWAELETLMGTRSTFYVYPGPGPAAPRHFHDPHYDSHRSPFPETLAALSGRGWEIAVHHGIKAHGAAAYAESRDVLTRLGGATVSGSRSHYWSGVWKEPFEAWKAMDQAGFDCDASLTPQSLGYRGGTMLPTMPSMTWRPGPDHGFVVLPTALMDAYAHPAFSPLDPERIHPAVDRLIANARRGGLLVTDWHVRTFLNAGAHEGMLDVFMEKIWGLASDPDLVLMTAREAAARWRAHCARCWLGGEDR